MPSPISYWYGNNTISWGSSYSESHFGNANEANSWGIIYPATAGGSSLTVDTSSILADSTSITVDQTQI